MLDREAFLRGRPIYDDILTDRDRTTRSPRVTKSHKYHSTVADEIMIAHEVSQHKFLIGSVTFSIVRSMMISGLWTNFKKYILSTFWRN